MTPVTAKCVSTCDEEAEVDEIWLRMFSFHIFAQCLPALACVDFDFLRGQGVGHCGGDTPLAHDTKVNAPPRDATHPQCLLKCWCPLRCAGAPASNPFGLQSIRSVGQSHLQPNKILMWITYSEMRIL